ncbi:MAG TPA: SUMF1/EgtB/PvdO family nonheme iron enzyme, partial [Reyranella sp.]|nr:SUMF1/EgtB/PvdO family nonheme iron enzyme [Reyranella sp.]
MDFMLNRHMLALVAPLVIFGCAPAGTEATATGEVAQTRQSAAEVEPDPRLFRDCADCPQMVRIPAGSFTMGSPADEPERQADEGPQRKVTIAKPFAISAYEISSGEYRRFIESTGRTEVDWKMAWTWQTVAVGKAPMEPD